MTRLPHPSRLAIDRPDLPEYELNNACPITGEVTGLESHHLWRRSAGYRSWWVELPDGEVVGNRIKLSSKAHYLVTVNKARISYESGVYYWVDEDGKAPLRWQPPTMHQRNPQGAVERLTERVDGLIENDKESAHSLAVAPGEECGLCHRRVPHPKKATSPSTKVFSTRVPVEDAESFDELIESLAGHLGVSSKPHHKFWAIHYAAVAVLQDETLKDVLNG